MSQLTKTSSGGGGGGVQNVFGTAGQIDSTGGVNPTISIDPAYVGQTSITTLGTITTGTWHGSTIDIAHGGTGDTSFTAYAVICGGTTSTNPLQNVVGLGSSTQVLTSNGPGLLPTWQNAAGGGVSSVSGTLNRITSTGGSTPVIDISASYVGQSSITTLGTIGTGVWNGSLIPLAYGGTNANLTASNGGIFYSTGTAGAILSGTATAGQLLTSGASTTPAWTTSTYPATNAVSTLLYASSVNVMAALATGNNGTLITSAGGVPSISSTLPSTVQGNITSVGTISSGTWNGSIIDLSHGGTNAALTANNGGIFYSTASAGAILSGTATANQVLLSGSSTTPAWSTATYPATTTINQILYSSSASVIGGITTGNNGVLITSGAGAPSISSTLPSAVQGNITTVGTIGTGVWQGTAVTVPNGGTGNTTFTAYSVICAGTTATGIFQNVSGLGSSGNVLTSNGAGALPTWQAASGGGTTWTDATNASYTVAAANGYVADRSSLVTFTLPTNNNLGDTIYIVGKGSGGWKIVWTTSQFVQFGTSAGTTTTGNIASTNQFDCCTLVCTTASASAPVFSIISSIGNLTVA